MAASGTAGPGANGTNVESTLEIVSKRRTVIMLAGAAVAGVALAACVLFGPTGNDEKAFYQSVRNMRFVSAVRSKCLWLPGPLLQPINRARDKATDRVLAQQEALLASGFLTNLSVTLSNASAQFCTVETNPPHAELRQVLHAAIGDAPWLPFIVRRDFQSNRVSLEVTCRTRDVPLIVKALERY